MRPAAPLRVALALASAVLATLLSASLARACLFSNVASAYANGALAYRVKVLPATQQGEALWAPFAFRQQFAPSQVLHLREDMKEVAKSFGSVALHWRVRWLFGDGTQASGFSVAHTYRHRGVYKIEVKSYFPKGAAKGWYDFDTIDVAIGPLPANVTWMRVARP